MNVLQVTLRDLIGQRYNGYGLHRSLRDGGHGSNMLVVEKRSDDPDIHSYTRGAEWFERGLYASERVTSLQGMLSPFGWSFPARRCFQSAQVVHWHMIYPHFVSLLSMPWLTRLRPTIWTLHDTWALTGHCVWPVECQRWKTGCGRCPDLKRNFSVWFDTTALVWRTKRAVFARSPLTLVVASRWMKSQVEASPLLRSFPCHLIPFGLELERWRPLDREACRAKLGIPAGARAIAFRMPQGHRHELTKGIPLLLEALRRLPVREPTYLIVFQQRGHLEEFRGKYSLVELGWTNDDTQVAEALTAADLFVMPSTAESFGLMALEAMACGTAVVVTEGTSLTEIVRTPSAGIAVPAGDAEALTRTIESLLADDARRSILGRRGREIVEAEHSHDAYFQRHVALYTSLLEGTPATRGIPA